MSAAPATTAEKCAAGFYCKKKATTKWPVTERSGYYGPCPAGYYCPEGTEDPTACPDGTFNPQKGAWSADFCLPCPPGWLCTTPGATGGLSEPSSECSAGNRCSDGLNEVPCTTSGNYCPIESYHELICPTGFYNTV